MDIDGKDELRPKDCTNWEKKSLTNCPYIKNTYEGWDSETWSCETCGEYFHLYYDDMA